MTNYHLAINGIKNYWIYVLMKLKGKANYFPNKLKDVLNDYLRFRHFIRNTYSYKIKWERMEDLIINIAENWNNIKMEIADFVEHCKKQPNGTNQYEHKE